MARLEVRFGRAPHVVRDGRQREVADHVQPQPVRRAHRRVLDKVDVEWDVPLPLAQSERLPLAHQALVNRPRALLPRRAAVAVAAVLGLDFRRRAVQIFEVDSPEVGHERARAVLPGE